MAITAFELQGFQRGRRRRSRASPPRAVRLMDSDVFDFDPRLPARAKIVAYCRYVRALITADGVASALSVSRKTASEYLEQLTRAGYLHSRRSRRMVGAFAKVWEWALD